MSNSKGTVNDKASAVLSMVTNTVSTGKGGNFVQTAIFYVVIIIFIILTILGFHKISTVVGSREDITTLKPQLLEILSYIFFTTLLSCIAVVMYFVQDNTYSIYFSLFISMFSIGMAYAALVVSSITR